MIRLFYTFPSRVTELVLQRLSAAWQPYILYTYVDVLNVNLFHWRDFLKFFIEIQDALLATPVYIGQYRLYMNSCLFTGCTERKRYYGKINEHVVSNRSTSQSWIVESSCHS